MCSPKKAIILLFLMKADLVAEKSNRFIRSINNSFAYPSVIKLNSYLRIPYRQIELNKKNIIKRDNNKCQYCGGKDQNMTVDHILPRSRGGADTWENLITACNRCNNRKGNQTPDEADMKLSSIPKKPHHILFMKLNIGTFEDNWRPYLFMD